MPTFTDDDLNNLRSIIASGVTRVIFDNKQIDYAKLDDLLKAEQIVSAGTTPVPDPTTGVVPIRSRQIRVFTAKGI
jgi:hypothetical protein